MGRVAEVDPDQARGPQRRRAAFGHKAGDSQPLSYIVCKLRLWRIGASEAVCLSELKSDRCRKEIDYLQGVRRL